MSVIKPFRALRPRPELAAQVSCIPYDVPYDAEVRAHVASNPVSFLRVTRAEAEFPVAFAPTPEAVLERSKENFRKMIEDGVLVQDDEPSIYLYRMSANGHTQTGLVACCSLVEYENGGIKKHEKTRPDKVNDRTAHMVALRAQTGLILLAFRNTEKIRRLIETETAGEPIYDRTCESGRQMVWRAEAADDIVDAFREVAALYIADGHHRIESALRAKDMLDDASTDRNYVMAGIFPSEDLRILPYNRVVKDLNGLSEPELLKALGDSFEVSETDKSEPTRHGDICMYMSGRWYLLRYKAGHDADLDPIERLDVTILQKSVLQDILGIDDPRTDERIAFVGGGRGTAELTKLVDSGEASVAFSMFHTTMEDLFAVSDMGEIMPPKSTWFEPKLKDGLFVHLI